MFWRELDVKVYKINHCEAGSESDVSLNQLFSVKLNVLAGEVMDNIKLKLTCFSNCL